MCCCYSFACACGWQEHTFKEILLEREAEIVRLHQAMRDLEVRQHAAMEAKVAETCTEIAGLKAEVHEKDTLLRATANNLAAVVGAVNAVNYSVEAATSPFVGSQYVAAETGVVVGSAAAADGEGDEDY
jgi:hypothetical protein